MVWKRKAKNRSIERRQVLDVKVARRQAVRNRVRVATFAASLSPLALALLVLAWTAAAFVGGFACAKLAGSYRTWLGLSIGVLVGAMNAANAAQVVHPAWVEVANIALPPLAAWFGAWLAQRPAADQNGLASTR